MKKKSRSAKAKAPAALPAALLASALQAQGDGVVVSALPAKGQKAGIIFANESFCTMSGRAAAGLAGLPHAALHADRTDWEKFERWLRTAPPGKVLAGEGYLVGREGATPYASWTFGVIRNTRRRPTHLVATYRDTTEKRRLQEALVHAQRLDAVGRLAGGVAHDFNNLLSVINGYCEMLAAQVSDRPHALREVNEIHRAGMQAAALTRQLLAFGRRQPMDARVIDLNRLVSDNAEIMSRLVGSAGKLELDLAENLGRTRADPTQFQQVILNLVINARDALRDKGCITITTANREIAAGLNRRVTDVPPGRYVSIAVSDNGTGMDAETQKHLFEPFFTTKPEGKGTGLGLALVYGVVQQSAGYITVRSALLAGSTFEILLPEFTGSEEPADLGGPVSPLPATRGHETLLLLEEDDVVRKMVAGMLTADGYRVLAAKTPTEALKLFRAHARPVQLLIANPRQGGSTVARSLLEAKKDLRMLCTSNHETLPPLSWLKKEHQASMVKPYALSEILLTVRTLLDA
ncbi:MAG: PAS domain S-box protein [Verrucomicrobia bacterium]|nr:PAS domain S-box protein [Verrucomicrobiota bacterium]